MLIFFCLKLEISSLEKLISIYQSRYKFLFNLFNFIMSNFCFDKLAKISE